MSEPFIAEIRIFAGDFAPRAWAFCNGQLLKIETNTALFSLIGTTYGGDGRKTTGLPDLQGRAAMGQGRGPELTPRRLGEKGGAATVTLSEAQLANHTHTLRASQRAATNEFPSDKNILATAQEVAYRVPRKNLVDMAETVLQQAGNSQPHNNMQPYIAMNYIIALLGVYPTRS